MINRREFLGIAGRRRRGAGTHARSCSAHFEQSGGKLIQRAIPSSGEMLPVISFAPRPGAADPAAFKDSPRRTLSRQWRQSRRRAARRASCGAGRPRGCQRARDSEQFLLDDAPGHHARLSCPEPPPPKPDPAATKAALEEKFATFKVSKIDLVHGVGRRRSRRTGAPRIPQADEEGRAGPVHRRARAFVPAESPELPRTRRPPSSRRSCATSRSTSSPPTTHVGDRRLEETILPLAQERKIAFDGVLPLRPRPHLPAREQHAASGVGRRVRREDVGAILPQVRPQPSGHHRGPDWHDQAGAHAREHERRHRAACRTRRCGSAWRNSWIHSLRHRLPGRRTPPPGVTVVVPCPQPSSIATSVSTRRRPDSRRPSAATATN